MNSENSNRITTIGATSYDNFIFAFTDEYKRTTLWNDLLAPKYNAISSKKRLRPPKSRSVSGNEPGTV